MNTVQENVTNSHNAIPLNHSDLKINLVPNKNQNQPSSHCIQFSSEEDNTIIKKKYVKSTVLDNDRIQISSDEDTTNSLSDSGCHYAKKKYRKHRLNKSTLKSKSCNTIEVNDIFGLIS